MYKGIIKNIDMDININAKKRAEGNIDIKLYSKDIGTGVFEFTFVDENNIKIELDETYSARVMLKTNYNYKTYITDVEIVDGAAKFVFPHRFITESGIITLYLYLTKEDKTSDVAAISFNVYRSEIDDVATDVITTYDKNYEDILADFEEYINISKDEWKTLIKETSDFVKEIENITLDEFISQKIDEKYNNIEQNYITRLLKTEQDVFSLNEQLAQKASLLKTEDLTVNIPSDYPTLQTAFDNVSSFFFAPGTKVYINIESGFKPKEGIKLKKRDYRFIELKSDDEIVEVHDDFEGNFISGSDCEFPIFNLLVDMRGKGSMGVALYANANVTISDGCGVKNAGYTGVFVNRLSRLYTHDGIFSGAGTYGMFVDHVGYVYARYVNLNDSGGNGLRATKGSIVEVANAEIKNATNTAILASDGTRVIGITDPTRRDKHIDVSGSGGDGIRMINGSEFIGDKVIINDCVGNGVYCEDGSKALINTTTMNNIQVGAVVMRNSSLSIRRGEILNARGHGIYSSDSSTVDAPEIKVRASGIGVTLNYGCNGNVRGADLKDCRSAVNVTEGSILNANGVDGTGHTGRNAFLVYTGGIINASGALGALRIEPNTITSDGIIFQ